MFSAVALSLIVAIAAPAERLQREGADAYATHCLQCHGADLRGSRAMPSLLPSGQAGLDFMMSSGRMPLDVPGTEPERGPPSLAPHQIAAILTYARAHGVRDPAIPRVEPSRDLTRGRKIYEENCEACHGAGGDGATVGYGWVAPTLHAATPVQIAEAVRSGPGMMPKYDARAIGERDLDALVAYVRTFDRVENAGGYSLASSGPVGEGLFAWAFGLGGLVLFLRFIGEGASTRDPRE